MEIYTINICKFLLDFILLATTEISLRFFSEIEIIMFMRENK